MQTQVETTTEEKIKIVQSIMDEIGTKITITEENYLWGFSVYVNGCIKFLCWQKTDTGELVKDEGYIEYFYYEVLPKYSLILGYDLDVYRKEFYNKLRKKPLL